MLVLVSKKKSALLGIDVNRELLLEIMRRRTDGSPVRKKRNAHWTQKTDPK